MTTPVPALDLFEATPNPYLLLAPDSPAFTIVGVNDAYLRATLTERVAIIGRPLFEVFPDDPATPEARGERNLRASLERTLETRQPDRMPVQHFNIRCSDGVFQERHWRPLSVPVLGPGNEVVSLIHYVEDVTQGVIDARAAQNALTASEARYRAIVESSVDYAMVATDLAGVITTWNAGAEHILGWTKAEMVGQTVERFFTPEDRANHIPAQEMHSALEKGRGLDERWHVRKDGERFWASGELMPLKDDGGTVIGFLKILRDRTAQREIEQALERQSSLLQTVTDHVSEAVFRLDADGTILLANPAAERLFGWQAEELKGRNLHNTLHYRREDGSPFPAETCAFVRALRNMVPLVEEEAVFFRKDGSPVPVSCNNVPLHIAGRDPGAVITITDLTERRRAQEQQQVVNRELGHRMKNLLTVVQAISRQTLRKAPNLSAANETLSDRLVALGKAQDMLLEADLQGAEIHALVTAAVGLHNDQQPGRFRIEGPTVAVGENATVPLTLMLHELATNATKYGALSVPEGSVHIVWEVSHANDPASFKLRWTEHDGPPVVLPDRKGFGSQLIQRGMPNASGGKVAVLYEPGGVECTLDAPLAGIEAS